MGRIDIKPRKKKLITRSSNNFIIKISNTIFFTSFTTINIW